MKVKFEKEDQITMIRVLNMVQGYVISVTGRNGTVIGRLADIDFDEDALPVLIVSEYDSHMKPTGDHRRLELGPCWDDVEVRVL